MFPTTVLLILSLLHPRKDEGTLGEFRQGLYAGRMKHGASIRIRLEDIPDHQGRIRGTLTGFVPNGSAEVFGTLDRSRLTLFASAEMKADQRLAEGDLAERDEERTEARLVLRFLLRPSLPAAPEEFIRAWIAQLDHDDPKIRHEATGALVRVDAEEMLKRAAETSSSPEARARLGEILNERVTLTQVSRDFSVDLTQGEIVRVRLRFPIPVSGPPALRDAGLILKRKCLRRTLSEYRGFLEELEDEETGPRFRHYEEDWGISFASGPLVSFSAMVSTYTGGAHHNYHFRSKTLWVDGTTARTVRLADLFLPCSYWEQRLSERVIAGLRERGASSVVDGIVTSLDERDLSIWAATPTGLAFFFAPYEMGCFAEGSYIVEVTYSAIADLLASHGPASALPPSRP